MRGQLIGSLVAVVFGVVYVVVNSGDLTSAPRWGLRAVAVVIAIGVLVLIGRQRGRAQAPTPPGGARFGRSYWLIVAVEAVLLFGGVRVLSGPLDRPAAGVAWVSLIVGVHFFALGRLFRRSFFHVLAVSITVCGVAGLTLAFTGSAKTVIDVIAGVVPGFLLLGFAWWGASQRPETVAAADG